MRRAALAATVVAGMAVTGCVATVHRGERSAISRSGEASAVGTRAAVSSHDVYRSLYGAPAASHRSSALLARPRKHAGAKGDVRDIYDKVGPATVIVQSQDGMGTGVIIRADGWILTNWHVVAAGRQTDFRYTVDVELGTIGPFGAIVRNRKHYRAQVYKADPVIDLALLKLIDAPADLPSVPIAAVDPHPGEPVTSIGHAGVGLLWAIKDCEVSSVGKLSLALAELVTMACPDGEAASDEAAGDTDAHAECLERRAAVEAEQRALEADNPALVIQSSCEIWPGDSGGPLVNHAGDLVGLNAFIRTSQGKSNFHIHVHEIRKFLAADAFTGSPRQILPDRWRDGGSEASLGDGDLDGRVDLLVFSGDHGNAVFFDLDQDSTGRTSTVDVSDIVQRKAFDAELVILQVDGAGYAWYDLDNDGRYDVLLLDGDGDGRIETEYPMAADETLLTRAAGTGKIAEPTRFADRRLSDRLAAIGEKLFRGHDVLGSETTMLRMPDPVHGGGSPAATLDVDEDGIPDTVRLKGLFSRGALFDADQDSGALREKRPTVRSETLDDLDVETSVVAEGDHLWAAYDTNDDRRLDLMLQASADGSGAVVNAWDLDADGTLGARRNDPVGRKIIRPALLGATPAAARLHAIATAMLNEQIVASVDDGLDTFPSLTAFAEASFDDVDGWPRAVVNAIGENGEEAMLIDLNRNTFGKGRRVPEDPSELVADGGFDAEFAYLHESDLEWFFYDTDDDGRFDVVVFTSAPESGIATNGFRIDRSGAVRQDPALAGRKLVRPALYKHAALARALASVASKTFQPVAIETR
jgi:hypothetical protein